MDDGLNKTLELVKHWQDILKRASQTPKTAIQDSQRMASAGTQMKERGSLKDRLGKNDAEAEINAKVENLRMGRPSEEPSDLTAEEQEAIDDGIIAKLVDDMIEKTILGGN